MLANKAPNAYAAMKHGTGAPPPSVIGTSITHVSEEPAKKGRPSKDEIRKRKMAAASAGIAALLASKHTRAKVRDYFESRIMALDEEKR
jgi:hypothetical protein